MEVRERHNLSRGSDSSENLPGAMETRSAPQSAATHGGNKPRPGTQSAAPYATKTSSSPTGGTATGRSRTPGGAYGDDGAAFTTPASALRPAVYNEPDGKTWEGEMESEMYNGAYGSREQLTKKDLMNTDAWMFPVRPVFPSMCPTLTTNWCSLAQCTIHSRCTSYR